MGDRSNIKVGDVYLYSHWDGDEILKSALIGAESGRTNDAPYLARIIFSSMVSNDLNSETGYGIATYPPDNEHPIIVFDGQGNAGVEGYGLTTCKVFAALVDVVLADDRIDGDKIEAVGERIKEVLK